MFFVAELGALFLILNSNAKREEDKGVPLGTGTDSIIYIAVTMFFVAELGALFLILNSNAKREEDKDSTRRDIFLPRCGNVQV